jgi:hypothetical protein
MTHGSAVALLIAATLLGSSCGDSRPRVPSSPVTTTQLSIDDIGAGLLPKGLPTSLLEGLTGGQQWIVSAFVTLADTTCVEFSFPNAPEAVARRLCAATPVELMGHLNAASIARRKFEPRVGPPGSIVERVDAGEESAFLVGVLDQRIQNIRLQLDGHVLFQYSSSELLVFDGFAFRTIVIPDPGSFDTVTGIDENGSVIASVSRETINQY